MCTMFHTSSNHLCSSIAEAAKRLCCNHLNPSILQPFIACHLTPLSKNHGVRPIGICETLRRIIGKAVLRVLGREIQSVAGSQQLCARQKAGCEAAIGAMKSVFMREEVEGLLFVDAENAFNSLNRGVMLHNLEVLCPSLATCVTNL